MILNALIDGVEVRRSPGGNPEGLTVDLRFSDVKSNGDNIEAAFVYQANYEKDIGFLQMTGRLLLRPPTPQAREQVLKSWANGQGLPADFAQEAMTAAHHVCAINSPFATRIVDLAPPILPMQMKFSPEQTQVGRPGPGGIASVGGARAVPAPGAGIQGGAGAAGTPRGGMGSASRAPVRPVKPSVGARAKSK